MRRGAWFPVPSSRIRRRLRVETRRRRFDAVTTVYTLRNFPDLRRGVEEMYRVTKPGGSVVILDAFPPSNAFVKSALYVCGSSWSCPSSPDS